MAFNEGLWGVRWVEGGMLLQYVSKMVPSTETIRLIGDGGGGGGDEVWWGKREIIYLPLHCHHQNDSSIKVGSDESHFNV